jgi:hypothetical protein
MSSLRVQCGGSEEDEPASTEIGLPLSGIESTGMTVIPVRLETGKRWAAADSKNQIM